uniref:Calmodulin binding transcription activator 1 n=1 Tax=Sarcophilus harrisii TaxID=9305 RepID=A0A7N4PJB0_SARHA
SSSGCLQGKNNEESFLLELSSKLPLPPLFLYPNFDWKLEGKWIIQQYLPPQKGVFLQHSPEQALCCLPAPWVWVLVEDWNVRSAVAIGKIITAFSSQHFLMDDHGNSNGSHVKIFLPKKLLECLPKCSSLPKERHRWNTNERS